MFRRLRSVAAMVFALILPGVILVATLMVSTPRPRPVTPVTTVPLEPVTLTMLAGSELDDVLRGSKLHDTDPAESALATGDPVFLDKLREETGITLDVKFTGSLSGAEYLTAGDPYDYDLAWFASDAYLQVLNTGGASPIVEQAPIMRSPVVLGVKHSVAEEYGWKKDQAVSWRDIAEKVKPKDTGFTFAMTDPTASNSGLAALVEAAVAMKEDRGSTELSEADIDDAVTPLQALFQGVGLTAGSSGWLSDQYFKEQSDFDGLVNYESEIQALNERPGIQRLDIIHPSDGVVTANYPLMLLRNETPNLAEYKRLAQWLRSEWAQQRLAEHTRRHRINEAAGQDRQIALPSDKSRLDQLLLSYQDKIRKPPRTFYIVDKSASMHLSQYSGSSISKLDKLKELFQELANDQLVTAARFRRLRIRERITILPFDDPVRGQIGSAGDLQDLRPAEEQTIREGQVGTADRQMLADYVQGLTPGGATALFDALYEAYVRLDREAEASGLEDYLAEWYPSIVLLTDGVQYQGIKRSRFEQLWGQTLSGKDVRVFAVHIGSQKVAAQCKTREAKKPDLCVIATRTGGRVFDTSNADLLDVIREIRGYQ